MMYVKTIISSVLIFLMSSSLSWGSWTVDCKENQERKRYPSNDVRNKLELSGNSFQEGEKVYFNPEWSDYFTKNGFSNEFFIDTASVDRFSNKPNTFSYISNDGAIQGTVVVSIGMANILFLDDFFSLGFINCGISVDGVSVH